MSKTGQPTFPEFERSALFYNNRRVKRARNWALPQEEKNRPVTSALLEQIAIAALHFAAMLSAKAKGFSVQEAEADSTKLRFREWMTQLNGFVDENLDGSDNLSDDSGSEVDVDNSLEGLIAQGVS